MYKSSTKNCAASACGFSASFGRPLPLECSVSELSTDLCPCLICCPPANLKKSRVFEFVSFKWKRSLPSSGCLPSTQKSDIFCKGWVQLGLEGCSDSCSSPVPKPKHREAHCQRGKVLDSRAKTIPEILGKAALLLKVCKCRVSCHVLARAQAA